MKLKILNLFLLILIFQRTEAHGRFCKTEILRSFGIHGRISPNNNNPLCPLVHLNCCTMHDLMHIHKAYTDHSKNTLNTIYKSSIQEMNNFINKLVATKDFIDMKSLIEKFEKEEPKPEIELIEHLKQIQAVYQKQDAAFYETITKPMEKRYQNVYKKISNLRQSFYCGICNWHNLDFISPETMTINYHKKFCSQLVKENLDAWSDKYGKIFNLGLLLDEFIYLISNYRLITSQSDREIMHRYKVTIEKCEKGDQEFCNELCKEFNINKFSYLIDGEGDFIKSFNYELERLKPLLTDEKQQPLLFKNRRESFMTFDYEKFKNHTVLKEDAMEVEDEEAEMKEKLRGENPLEGLSLEAQQSFIERFHPQNNAQIETLDDQVDTFILFRMIEEPIDVSEYNIVIQDAWGYNPYNDGKKLNMDEPVEKFLALLHTGGKDSNALDEHIEEIVEEFLNSIAIDDITEFVNDDSLKFKKMVGNDALKKLKALKDAHAKKKAEKKKNQGRELLGNIGIYFFNSLAIILMMLVN